MRHGIYPRAIEQYNSHFATLNGYRTQYGYFTGTNDVYMGTNSIVMGGIYGA